uniref:Pre-mRNA-splicing factor Syf1/CRNKL1-like C-terminal HAT-repeats domain-containing protein n=1 Tax=Solanum lycopersicum TaxID=4081 RepID=A0A3Q7J9K9_SOLLC
MLRYLAFREHKRYILQVIESGLPYKDAKVVCLNYAEFEKFLANIDYARTLYKHSSQFTNPRSDPSL